MKASLYVFRRDVNDNKKQIIAISENRDMIKRYIDTFRGYFDNYGGGFAIDEVVGISKCTSLIIENGDLVLQPFTDNYVLTEKEVEYYTGHMKNDYMGFKKTIINLIRLHKIIKLPEDTSISIENIVKTMVDEIPSFNEYCKLLTDDYYSKMLISPMEVDEHWELESEMDNRYRYLLDKED